MIVRSAARVNHGVLRTSLYLFKSKPVYKRFHTSPRSQWIEPTLTATHTILENLHNTSSLPWVLTLPLGALIVRLTIILPISLYVRSAQQYQNELQPLVHAWRNQIRRKVINEAGHLSPAYCTLQVKLQTRAKRKELYKRHSCGWWKNFLPLGQWPIFLVLIETVRAMCGMDKGLLALIAGSFASIKGQDTLNKVDHALSGTAEQLIPLEATFATEGALWFPNLLVPDPYLALPFMLSGSMFVNIWLSTRSLQHGAVQSVFQRRLTNAMKFIALIVGPATLELPSAMLVYWISNSSFAMAQNLLLDKIMPLNKVVKPCKPKPVR